MNFQSFEELEILQWQVWKFISVTWYSYNCGLCGYFPLLFPFSFQENSDELYKLTCSKAFLFNMQVLHFQGIILSTLLSFFLWTQTLMFLRHLSKFCRVPFPVLCESLFKHFQYCVSRCSNKCPMSSPLWGGYSIYKVPFHTSKMYLWLVFICCPIWHLFSTLSWPFITDPTVKVSRYIPSSHVPQRCLNLQWLCSLEMELIVPEVFYADSSVFLFYTHHIVRTR